MTDVQPVRPYMQRLSTLTNILEEKENNRQKILDFMQNAPCICFMKDSTTGKYEFVNKAFCDVEKLTLESVLGKTDWELFPLEQARLQTNYDLEVLKHKQSIIYITSRHDKLYILSKFLVVNGTISIGCFGLALPPLFTLESKEAK